MDFNAFKDFFRSLWNMIMAIIDDIAGVGPEL